MSMYVSLWPCVRIFLGYIFQSLYEAFLKINVTIPILQGRPLSSWGKERDWGKKETVERGQREGSEKGNGARGRVGELKSPFPLCLSRVEAVYSVVVLVSWVLEEGQAKAWISTLLAFRGCFHIFLHEPKTPSVLGLLPLEYLTPLMLCLSSTLWGFFCTSPKVFVR